MKVKLLVPNWVERLGYNLRRENNGTVIEEEYYVTPCLYDHRVWMMESSTEGFFLIQGCYNSGSRILDLKKNAKGIFTRET